MVRKEMLWGGRKLTLETGRIAGQADGAAYVTYGDTVVLATVVCDTSKPTDADFVPLSVHYTEKYFASGRIPGGYGKREGRPSEKDTLTSRLIDRPLRPLFAPGFRFETQVIITVLSYDLHNDADVPAMIAASAAIALSGLPCEGPIAAARVGFINDAYVLNPGIRELPGSRLDLVVAGTADAVMMVESQADELSEAEMLAAVDFGHAQMQPVIELIRSLAAEAGQPKHPLPEVPGVALLPRAKELAEEAMRAAFAIAEKKARRSGVSVAIKAAIAQLVAEGADERNAKAALKLLEQAIVRGDILAGRARIGGRGTADIRPITCEHKLLPRTHGSALFTRGETQALAVATLGTDEDAVMVDALEGNYRERFMLHYNFPPYSVGEVGRPGTPGRREIGHGKLAWRALKAVMPTKEAFPYVVRVVSEITACNGSSSMATVCAASLALLDAGVPLRSPVAGIAMGLIKEGNEFKILSDILGDEDALGDMDFKVAGTATGITALQMDIKITGITHEIMEQALAQAGVGRTHILSKMSEALHLPEAFSAYAPQIVTIKIPTDKIREVIGSGGKVIREIVETSGAKIDVADDGTVKISAPESAAIERARSRILAITSDPEPGQIYEGKVVKVTDFGAFVNFFGARDGLVHVSQLAERRVEKPSDVVNEGDVVRVKMLGFDDRGKIKLTMRGLDPISEAS